VNYRIHTDAVKDYIIPKSTLPQSKQGIEYAKEGDILNLALFGCTAKEWKEANPQLFLNGGNIRDIASINELAVLSNMKSLNSVMIQEGANKSLRFKKLKHYAEDQLRILNSEDFMKSIRKETETAYLDPGQQNVSDFDRNIKKALNYNAKSKEA
jgi:hypothetical protein